MTMTWLIEPRDGLAFRDGRPNDGGSQSRSLAFPLPQTVAGAVRTRIGTNEEGVFDLTPQAVQGVEVVGPLLVRGSGTSVPTLLLPVPSDALWLEDPDTKAKTILPLRPLEHEPEPILRGGRVPKGEYKDLYTVGLTANAQRDGKPPKGIPAFWTWDHLEKWLLEKPLNTDEVLKNGQKALEHDRRTHVAINPETGTYVDGALFGVSSLVFRSAQQPGIKQVEELSLLFQFGENPTGRGLKAGLGYMGGKNRLARFTEAGDNLWPQCPKELLDHAGRVGGAAKVRLLLLTPGLFTKGWIPEWLLQKVEGIETQAHLRAAKVDRPLTLSGWDYAAKDAKGHRGVPKETRRAVSAGTVYWLELEGAPDQRRAWVRHWWMKAVSDKEQDRRDGFGLAVMGVWV
jgi:CRISPR-associated protein Cmr3